MIRVATVTDRNQNSGKGRPTRTRKEAQAGRKRTFGATVDRKAARAQLREDRARARAGLAAGDPRYFPARDRGPVREFVRDYIDSRVSAGEFFVYFALVVALLSVVPNATVLRIIMLVWTGMIALVVVDTFYLWFSLRRAVARRFPGQDRGAVRYGLLRSLQVRPLRLPKARVRIGGKPKTSR